MASAYLVCGSETSTSFGAQRLVLLRRGAHRRLHLRVHALDEVLRGTPERSPVTPSSSRRGSRGAGHARRGGVVRVVPAMTCKQRRRSPRRCGSMRPDLVERAGEGDHPVARDPPVGRLEPHDAGERRRLADGAAGVGAERAEDLPRRHRRRRAARTSRRGCARGPRGCASGRTPLDSVDEPMANSSMFSLPTIGSPASLAAAAPRCRRRAGRSPRGSSSRRWSPGPSVRRCP